MTNVALTGLARDLARRADEGRPVRSPFLAQLRTALPHLFSGPRPLTLLLVSGEGPRGRREALEQRASEWLADAYEFFDDVCHPG